MKILKPTEIGNWKGRFVDVRELDEYAHERLDRSDCQCIPLAQVAAAASAWDKNAPVLVMCKSGGRSRQAAQQLESLGFQDVTTLDGGITACRAAGLPVVAGKAPLPMFRQVLIGASAFLLAGLVLASFVHPAFIVLTWFVACGMMFAGVTGFCGLALVLAHMPWNKTQSCGASCSPKS